MVVKLRLLAALVVTAAGLILAAAPAGAVQTTTWGLVAAPDGHGFRSTITHPADGSTVHDAVIVFNRTDQPITIHLYLLDTTHVQQGYQFGPPNKGLAADTTLGAKSVTLQAHQQARVPVTIRMPRGTKTTILAGIAAEASAVRDGALSIQQQLVVLVKATPPTHLVPVVVKDIGIWGSAALLVLLLVAALVERERRRSKRAKSPVVTAAAA